MIFLNLTSIESFVIIVMFIDRYRLSMMPNEAIIFTLSNDEMLIME